MAGRVSRIAPIGSLLKGAQPQARPKKPAGKAPDHLALIRRCPCLSCGKEDCEAAHVRMTAGPKKQNALGKKPADDWAVPLCHGCHMRQHEIGEKPFWRHLKLDPLVIAGELAKASPDLTRMRATCLQIKR